MNFCKRGDHWIATAFHAEHNHSKTTTRLAKAYLRKQEIVELSFVFPTSIQSGMFFNDVHEVRSQIVREAIEKGLPMNIYNFKPDNPAIRFTCKICRSSVNLRKREKGLEVTTVSN